MFYNLENDKFYTLEELKEIHSESTDENKGTFERWLEQAQEEKTLIKIVKAKDNTMVEHLLERVNEWVNVQVVDLSTQEVLSYTDKHNAITQVYFLYEVIGTDYNATTSTLKIYIEKTEHIILCEHCLDYLRSRGERIFVLDEVTDDYAVCEWCNDELDNGKIFVCTFV